MTSKRSNSRIHGVLLDKKYVTVGVHGNGNNILPNQIQRNANILKPLQSEYLRSVLHPFANFVDPFIQYQHSVAETWKVVLVAMLYLK